MLGGAPAFAGGRGTSAARALARSQSAGAPGAADQDDAAAGNPMATLMSDDTTTVMVRVATSEDTPFLSQRNVLCELPVMKGCSSITR
jgi:hypothetical protein